LILFREALESKAFRKSRPEGFYSATFKGKTALDVATAAKRTAIIELLKNR